MLAHGAVGVVLALYLAALGLPEARIGLLFTLMLAGDTLISLVLSSHADRWGRRRTLIASAVLMAVSTAVFAGASEYVVLLLRFSISQMDVPARQSYTMAVVDPDERSAAAGITGVARSFGAALSPGLCGLLMANPALVGAPFVVAGALKAVYVLLLFRGFASLPVPGEGE